MIAPPAAGVVVGLVGGLSGIVHRHHIPRGDRLVDEPLPYILARGERLPQFVAAVPPFDHAARLPRRRGGDDAHDLLLRVVEGHAHLAALRQVVFQRAGQRSGLRQGIVRQFRRQVAGFREDQFPPAAYVLIREPGRSLQVVGPAGVAQRRQPVGAAEVELVGRGHEVAALGGRPSAERLPRDAILERATIAVRCQRIRRLILPPRHQAEFLSPRQRLGFHPGHRLQARLLAVRVIPEQQVDELVRRLLAGTHRDRIAQRCIHRQPELNGIRIPGPVAV